MNILASASIILHCHEWIYWEVMKCLDHPFTVILHEWIYWQVPRSSIHCPVTLINILASASITVMLQGLFWQVSRSLIHCYVTWMNILASASIIHSPSWCGHISSNSRSSIHCYDTRKNIWESAPVIHSLLCKGMNISVSVLITHSVLWYRKEYFGKCPDHPFIATVDK